MRGFTSFLKVLWSCSDDRRGIGVVGCRGLMGWDDGAGFVCYADSSANLRVFLLTGWTSSAHARVPLKHGRHTRVASCRTAVLGCIEVPPSSSRPTAAFAPQLLLPTCRAISASLPPLGSRSARTWPPPNSSRAVRSAAGLRLLPSVAEPTWITPAQVRESSLEGYLVLQTV
jgi:hypothetical protein